MGFSRDLKFFALPSSCPNSILTLGRFYIIIWLQYQIYHKNRQYYGRFLISISIWHSLYKKKGSNSNRVYFWNSSNNNGERDTRRISRKQVVHKIKKEPEVIYKSIRESRDEVNTLEHSSFDKCYKSL